MQLVIVILILVVAGFFACHHIYKAFKQPGDCGCGQGKNCRSKQKEKGNSSKT